MKIPGFICQKILEHRNSQRLVWRAFFRVYSIIICRLKKNRILGCLSVIFHTRYRFNKAIIEISLTDFCNLRCINCASSCRQAPDDEYITAKQVEFFVQESILNSWEWALIKLYGGEPTLNPEFAGIITALAKYKDAFPRCRFQILTNGFGKEVREKLAFLPQWVEIVNSHKEMKDCESRYFESYNLAPRDIKRYRFADYTKGCFRIERCGIGLNKHGFYPCAPGSYIDRILGFDIGIDNLKSALDSSFKEEMKKLCPYCGLYKQPRDFINVERLSFSWEAAYRNFKQKKPGLKTYGGGKFINSGCK